MLKPIISRMAASGSVSPSIVLDARLLLALEKGESEDEDQWRSGMKDQSKRRYKQQKDSMRLDRSQRNSQYVIQLHRVKRTLMCSSSAL